MSLRSDKDLSLETQKLLMSHCFAERRAEMPTSSIDYFGPSGLFSSILHVLITLTLQILGKKNSAIIKGDRDNNGGVLH